MLYGRFLFALVFRHPQHVELLPLTRLKLRLHLNPDNVETPNGPFLTCNVFPVSPSSLPPPPELLTKVPTGSRKETIDRVEAPNMFNLRQQCSTIPAINSRDP